MFGFHLNPEALRQAEIISSAFDRVDEDGDGIITFPELSDIFCQLASWTPEELEALFDAADRNGDGFIWYREFTAWLVGEWDAGGREATKAIANLQPKPIGGVPKASSSMRLFCMRHAKPEWWDRRKYPKGTVRDPGLSAIGLTQAQGLSTQLQRDVGSFEIIVCSPLARAIQTAAPLASIKPPIIKRAICHAQLCEHGSEPNDFDPDQIAAANPSLFGRSASHEVNFVGFGTTSPHDTQTRADIVAAWLRDESSRWPAGATIGIFSHQTFLDCLLQVLVLGNSSNWEYGWPHFKLAKPSISEFSFSLNGVEPVKLDVHVSSEFM